MNCGNGMMCVQCVYVGIMLCFVYAPVVAAVGLFFSLASFLSIYVPVSGTFASSFPPSIRQPVLLLFG